MKLLIRYPSFHYRSVQVLKVPLDKREFEKDIMISYTLGFVRLGFVLGFVHINCPVPCITFCRYIKLVGFNFKNSPVASYLVVFSAAFRVKCWKSIWTSELMRSSLFLRSSGGLINKIYGALMGSPVSGLLVEFILLSQKRIYHKLDYTPSHTWIRYRRYFHHKATYLYLTL